MVAFGSDPQASLANVASAISKSPAGSVEFNVVLSHRTIGNGWATWSHGYAGDVYATTTLSVTLSPMTPAFYFYAEPNSFGSYTITATASDGATTRSLSESVAGDHGAKGFGFYTDDGSSITSISVSANDLFAVGEFGVAAPAVATPEPASLALFGSGLLGFALVRRSRAAPQQTAFADHHEARTPSR